MYDDKNIKRKCCIINIPFLVLFILFLSFRQRRQEEKRKKKGEDMVWLWMRESISDLENLTVSTYFPQPHTHTQKKKLACHNRFNWVSNVLSNAFCSFFKCAFRSPSSSICFWHFHFDKYFFSFLKRFHYSIYI